MPLIALAVHPRLQTANNIERFRPLKIFSVPSSVSVLSLLPLSEGIIYGFLKSLDTRSTSRNNNNNNNHQLLELYAIKTCLTSHSTST